MSTILSKTNKRVATFLKQLFCYKKRYVMKNVDEWYSWRDLNPQKPDPKSGAYANSATAAYIK